MGVILVYTDFSRKAVTEMRAIELCSNPIISGQIVDALTDDAKLQSELRRMMDNPPVGNWHKHNR